MVEMCVQEQLVSVMVAVVVVVVVVIIVCHKTVHLQSAKLKERPGLTKTWIGSKGNLEDLTRSQERARQKDSLRILLILNRDPNDVLHDKRV